MKLINFNDFQQNQRMYGGTAGRKMGITYNGNCLNRLMNKNPVFSRVLEVVGSGKKR